jgi:hypothetical protein
MRLKLPFQGGCVVRLSLSSRPSSRGVGVLSSPFSLDTQASRRVPPAACPGWRVLTDGHASPGRRPVLMAGPATFDRSSTPWQACGRGKIREKTTAAEPRLSTWSRDVGGNLRADPTTRELAADDRGEGRGGPRLLAAAPPPPNRQSAGLVFFSRCSRSMPKRTAFSSLPPS